MNIKIEKVIDIETAKKCNVLLEELTKSQDRFDNLVNPNFKVENFFEKCINNKEQILLIARIEEDIVGFLHGFIKQMPMKFFREGIIQLNLLYVKSKYRRLGVATKLLNQFSETGNKNGFKNIEVSTLINNKDAIKFYEKNGFNTLSYELRKKISNN